MKRPLILSVVLCCASITLLYSITIRNEVDKKAEVDIFISTTQTTPATYVSPIDSNAEGRIARYSYYYKASNNISYWQQYYSRYLPTFIHPEERFLKPSQKTNIFTIVLTPEEIQDLTAQELDEIFLTIRQRTYSYNTTTGRLELYSYVMLMQEFVPLDVVISLTVSGVTNPAVFNSLSASLKIHYPEAEGETTIQ